MNIPTNTQVSNVFTGFPPVEEPHALTSEDSAPEPSELRKKFDEFVGQTFFQQMLGAMRKTVEKPAYFHGGRAEEVFQGQLDQVLSEHMTEATAADFTDPLFELYSLKRA